MYEQGTQGISPVKHTTRTVYITKIIYKMTENIESSVKIHLTKEKKNTTDFTAKKRKEKKKGDSNNEAQISQKQILSRKKKNQTNCMTDR